MFGFNKKKNCYNKTAKVLELYDMLLWLITNNMINTERYKKIIKRIKMLLASEDAAYDKFTAAEITSIAAKMIGLSDDETSVADIRFSTRMTVKYDILTNCSVSNGTLFPTLPEDFELCLFDIINSKIILDISKALDMKLKSLSLDDSKSKEYADKIRNLNSQFTLYKLSLYSLSERLALEAYYNIDDIPDINLDEIEKKFFKDKNSIFNFKKSISLKAFNDILEMFDSFNNVRLVADDPESIYDNLVYVTQMEVLLSYLNKEQLLLVSSICDRINSGNKLVMNNIRKLVREKVGEL